MDQFSMYLVVIAICAVALIVALALGTSLKRVKVSDERMKEIAGYIKKGAMAYLKRQYKVLIIFIVVIVIVLAVIPQLGGMVAAAYVIGAVFSILAGYAGMRAAVIANVRTASAAKDGMAPAFKVAFSGGSIMGLMVVGLGALGVCIVSLAFGSMDTLTGFSFGASSVALFCRVGGGIYTKAADVGADLVGKVEAGIPEDDPRNPAVIADNVGDNVGDVAGMGADLFESYVGCIVSAMLLAAALASGMAEKAQMFITLIVGCGIAASIISIVIVRTVKAKDVAKTLNVSTYIAAILLVVAALVLSLTIMNDIMYFFGILCGVVAGILIGQFTEIYTSSKYKHVKNIAGASETGSATTILSGYSIGLMSVLPTILTICAAILISYVLVGEIGVILAALGMLATVGVVISVDAYGPVADNAGGIAEMSGAGPEVRKITDHLDSIGNTTAAIGKGFSIGSAALTALALFIAYSQAVGITAANILNPFVIVGLFIGGMLSFIFAAMTISSVSKAANQMIEEVRRQFREHPGIMEGTEQPDYETCVSISTGAAIKEMIVPGIIAIVAPIIVGLALGKEALAGLLAGATVTGVLLAISMANSGGAWDNAKKYIEEGNHGGKGSEAHKAAVVGDTVGDPFKDTSGPSMNILIKLMSIVAVVFAPIIMAVGG
ncbi:MAG: sodium-translocating pyrophosphatase [Christensenellaceae bacterium]|jgi:K(+)-stimulated pyrophosphate-energized sodium pump